MKIEHLEYILMVAECGSISKAANLLYMTQPQLSHIIRDLEAELAFPIFVRKNSGIELSQKGEEFIIHAKRIINENNKILRMRRESDNVQYFNVSTIKTSLVLDCFLQLLAEHKKDSIHFSINESGSNSAVNDVYTQDAELGIVYLLSAERKSFLAEWESMGLKYEKICDLRHHIILSKHHPLIKRGKPIAREELYPYGMLRYTNGTLFGSKTADFIWYRSFLDLNRITRFIDVFDRATMHNLLRRTDFFTLGTDAGIYQEDFHDIVSVPFSDNDIPMKPIAEMGYIYNSRVSLGPVAKQLIKILNTAYGNNGD